MATLQNDGRTFLAEQFMAKAAYLAWGAGLAAWDATPQEEPTTATALVAEIGRRKASTQAYVVADPAGPIELPSGKYRVSATPTGLVYLRFVFDYADAEGRTVRELGIFVDPTVKGTVPATQNYLLPTDLDKPGRAYAIERVKAFPRVSTVRQVFEYVLPF